MTSYPASFAKCYTTVRLRELARKPVTPMVRGLMLNMCVIARIAARNRTGGLQRIGANSLISRESRQIEKHGGVAPGLLQCAGCPSEPENSRATKALQVA